MLWKTSAAWGIAVFMAGPGILAGHRAEAGPPNILFIFADDQTYESINAGGFPEVETPNLDRLVRSGTTFTRAYNPGGYHGAVCVASRTMLNTGRFLWHAKAADDAMKKGAWRHPFWSQRLKRAGYDTYMTGKWHIAKKAPEVFDIALHVRGGMPAQTPEGYNRPLEGEPDPWSPSDPRFGGFWEGGTHWSEVVADDALGFLQRAADREHPFFMYVAFNAPHDPRQSPREYVDMYPLEGVQVPVNYQDEYPYKDQIGCGPELRDEKLAPFPRTEHAVKVHRREYFAIITHMDAQIGRILDALEQSGMQENTYVFFTADHGLACGHHGLMGKQNLYEHSVRVPFIAVGPQFEKGKQIDVPIYLQDVMPTTLELAGLPIPDDCAFRSVLPLVRGEESTQSDAIYGAYRDLQRMVIADDMKLIVYPAVPRVLLFDLKQDPHEMRNLAQQPQHRERVRALFAVLKSLHKETGDQLDLTSLEKVLALR